MKRFLVSLLVIGLFISCGGDPILTGVKIDLQGKRHDEAYDKLSAGLYSEDGKNVNLKGLAEAWFEMGKLHNRKEETEKALAALEKASSLDKEKKYKDQIDNLKKFWGSQSYNTSIKVYNESLQLEGEEKTAKLNEAKKQLETSVAYDAQGYAYALLGRTYDALSEKENAESAYKKAIEMEDAGKIDSRFELAIFYFNNQMLEKSLGAFENVLAVDAKNRESLRYRAYAFQNLQKYDEAIKAYEALLAEYSDENDAKVYLATLYYNSKKYEMSANVYKAIIDADNGTDATNYVYLANSVFAHYNALNEAKQNKEAKVQLKVCVEYLNKALATDNHKENADIWNYLMIAHANLGNAKEAKKAEKQYKKFSH